MKLNVQLNVPYSQKINESQYVTKLKSGWTNELKPPTTTHQSSPSQFPVTPYSVQRKLAGDTVVSCATSPLDDKLPARFCLVGASYMAVCCSTQRTLEISWPCPSHRGLGRTLCCENIALGTSPQSSETKMSMPRHMEWLHPVSSHWSTSGLWEGPLGAGGGKKGIN